MQKMIKQLNYNRDLILLLMIGGLYSLGIFLSNSFVNVYLWKQSGDFITIASYNLAIYIFQALVFVIAGKMAKRMDRIVVLRLGVIFLSLFFLTVLAIGKQAPSFNILLGGLLGIGYGFYGLAYNVLTFEITEPETRDFFNGVFGVLQSFGGMVGPLVAGLIISTMTRNVGYTVIFAISFLLFILAVICSFFLQRRKATGNFYLKYILAERKVSPNWNNVLKAHFAQGLREGIFLFVITIWVYLMTKNELALGMFNLILSLFSLIFYFIVTASVKPSARKKAIFLGTFVLYTSLFLILFHANYMQFILYAVLIGAAFPLMNVPYTSMTYDVIGTSRGAKHFRIEYIVVRELFLNGGRILSIILFLLAISAYQIEEVLPVLLLIFGASPLFIYVFMRKIQLQPPESTIVLREK